ncbi:MAG: TMEM43 family protein [Candidatus Bathyarchaeota archaeon]|nr:TMEM43 family protein [Candidatus Bathyarchaeota archaeon]
MGSRIKVFAIIAVIGFLAGIIAQVAATYFIPWFMSVLPLLGDATSFIISGCVGAVLTVAIVSVWAYMTGKKDPY